MILSNFISQIDFTDPDNNGLELPIDALADIVDEYSTQGLSRADIWALAALTAADESQQTNGGGNIDDRVVRFPFEWYGRKDCPSPDGKSEENPTGLPGPNMDTKGLLHFFSKEFGLDAKETTALMGAHTLGTLTRENSGFDGPDGWVPNKGKLSNGYYDLLIGGQTKKGATLENSSIEDLMLASRWDLKKVDNSDLRSKGMDIADRYQWEHKKPNGLVIVMTHSDIAIIRNLEKWADDEGEVGDADCVILRKKLLPNSCPKSKQTFKQAAKYKYDNDLWLRDFDVVFRKVLNKGYNTSELCDEPPCELTQI